MRETRSSSARLGVLAAAAPSLRCPVESRDETPKDGAGDNLFTADSPSLASISPVGPQGHFFTVSTPGFIGRFENVMLTS